MSPTKPSFIVIGLALFSMFFGSGNLIFPLMLGRDGGSLFWVSALGFILSAIFIPLAGVMAIIKADGDYKKIFEGILGKKLSLLLLALMFIFFIPLGAGPRCVNLPYASLATFMPMPPQWIFSISFLALVAVLISNKNKVVDILGKFLTPILLLCIFAIVFFSIKNGHMDPPLYEAKDLFFVSLFEGYNTQDLFSALFFSSSLLMIIRGSFSSKKEMALVVTKGALLGIAILTLLYVLIMLASSFHNDILKNESGIKLVSILAKQTLGHFGIIASLAVFFACLTTEIAMVIAFRDFLFDLKITRSSPAATFLALSLIFCTSLISFEQITYVISFTMKFLYPATLVLVLMYLLQRKKN